jgi:hypothetical protein
MVEELIHSCARKCSTSPPPIHSITMAGTGASHTPYRRSNYGQFAGGRGRGRVRRWDAGLPHSRESVYGVDLNYDLYVEEEAQMMYCLQQLKIIGKDCNAKATRNADQEESARASRWNMVDLQAHVQQLDEQCARLKKLLDDSFDMRAYSKRR